MGPVDLSTVPGPPAETGDGPGGPGEAVGRVGVLLFERATLQSLKQGVQDLDLGVVDDTAGGRPGAGDRVGGGAGEHELHGDGGADEGDHGEFFERGAVLDHALLDA